MKELTCCLPLQLVNHIPVKCLPVELGGDLTFDHQAWLVQCLASMTNRDPSTVCEPSPPLTHFPDTDNHNTMIPEDEPNSCVEQVCQSITYSLTCSLTHSLTHSVEIHHSACGFVGLLNVNSNISCSCSKRERM